MKVFVLFSTVLVLFFACEEKQEKAIQTNKIEHVNPFLFNLQNMWNDFEQRVSFPNWFNDSIIQSRQIKAIHRTIFEQPTSKNENNYPDSIYLKEKISYYFYPNGHIRTLSITSFVEGEKLGTATFNYLNDKDHNGYAYPHLNDSFSMNSERINNHYKIDTMLFMHKDYLRFVEKTTGNHLYVVLNSKKLDALMIDSILKPNFSDWLIQGNPSKATKIYKLKNKVNQLQVRNFSYFQNNKQLKSYVREHFPFETRRSLILSNNTCIGFIDSTFSNSSFLFKCVYDFNGKDLITPEKVTIQKTNHEASGPWETIEYYNYEKQPQTNR